MDVLTNALGRLVARHVKMAKEQGIESPSYGVDFKARNSKVINKQVWDFRLNAYNCFFI